MEQDFIIIIESDEDEGMSVYAFNIMRYMRMS